MYCAVFAVTVWLRLNNSIGSEHEVRQLRNMIYSYLGMLVTDILWAFMEDGIIYLPRFLNAFVNSITIMSIVCGCYFWFRFIEDRVHFVFASKKILNTLLKIPLLMLCALDLISIFTGWIFYIDAEGHYQTASLFELQTAVNYFYLLVPTVYSIYRAIKTPSKQERSEYYTYALYMVAPLISGLLEDTFPRVPLLALNIFLMILILFLMIQNMQIYNDALTGLNNRRRLNQYLEDCLIKASLEHPVLLFIMDINSFKSINDIYGHLEGDNALKAFSNVLKNIASKHNAFAARYGGDEFCMVMDLAGHTPEEIITDIQQSLQSVQMKRMENSKEYTLTISVGYTVCDRAENRPDSVLAAADALLYERKKEWHNSR
jgi:diguanylate cyclase (GGDEF)-like protein